MSFYRAFEDEHRGSRELISDRLKVYLPFVAPLKEASLPAPILDIGCGRGEWLELLIDHGFNAMGIDLDLGMLEACRERSLPAEQGDALSVLKSKADASLAAVTAFHVVEHIPFESLQELVSEAIRVLIPGGLLILETPNSENMAVGTSGFYMDPTHERPIPHLLLSFLVEHLGFARWKLLRLQEPAELHSPDRVIDLMSVLAGVSPDYSIIGQKGAEADVMEAFEIPFAVSHGISLAELAERYDTGIRDRLHELEGRLEQMIDARLVIHAAANADLPTGSSADPSAPLDHPERRNMEPFNQMLAISEKLQEAQLTSHALQQQLDSSLSNAHCWYLRAMAAEAEIEALRASASWRVTAPWRVFSRLALVVVRGPGGGGIAGRVAAHARLWIARRPGLESRAVAILARYPRVAARLRRLHRSGVPVTDLPQESIDPRRGVLDLAPLTKRGQAIELALREAAEKDR
jgi:O-antigen chain-terminating methyltransferase